MLLNKHISHKRNIALFIKEPSKHLLCFRGICSSSYEERRFKMAATPSGLSDKENGLDELAFFVEKSGGQRKQSRKKSLHAYFFRLASYRGKYLPVKFMGFSGGKTGMKETFARMGRSCFMMVVIKKHIYKLNSMYIFLNCQH